MSRQPSLSIPLVLVFYGLMAAVAVLWDVLRSGPSTLLPVGDGPGPLVSAGLAVGVAVAAIAASRLLERALPSFRRVAELMARMIGPLDTAQIVVFASASAVAEEMLFRGPMQATLGLWVTSLIFGLGHGYFERRFIPWTVMATVVGLGLGWLAQVTGGLLAPVLAHFTVNYFEFHALDRLARRLEGGSERL